MRFAHDDVGRSADRKTYRFYECADVGHRAPGCGTEKVGVSRNVRQTLIDVFAELVKSVVRKRRVKADYAKVGIVVHDFYAVKFELAFKTFVAKQKNALAAIVVENILASDLPASVNLVRISAQTEIVKARDIICVHSRRIVGEKANAFAHCAKFVYCGKRTFYFGVSDVHRAVKVENEQFYVFDVLHKYPSTQPNFFIKPLAYA